LRFSPVSTLTVTVPARRVQQVVELALARHGDLHAAQQGGSKIGAGRVQPRQYRCRDAVGAQRQRLVDGGNPEFGRSGGQCRARYPGGSVAVAVGLDHGHDLRGARVLAQHPHVVLDGAQVDDGFTEDAGRQGYRRNGHGPHCPRTIKVPRKCS
jgi:hypothetical protein